jgi:solute carrier family 5 (sodium-coupled monocarboxylate transporter), member 8/12
VQIIILFATLLTIAIKGTAIVGGLDVVIERNMNTGRIQSPDFRLDPTIKHSFWTLVVGGSIFYISATGLNQNMIQRFLSVKTVKKARTSNWINMCCIIFIVSVSCYNGLLTYAMYHDCDPFTTTLIDKPDQLLPLMVIEKFHDMPGFTGLFTAGVFAAALSTLSTAYNSMAAVAFEDIFKTFSKGPISEMKTFLIMRGTVFVLGTLSVVLVYVVQNLGELLQLTYTIPATSLGPMLGVFVIGFCLPSFGRKSTFFSACIVYFTLLTAVIVIQVKVAQGQIKAEQRETSIDGCPYTFPPIMTTPAPHPDLVQEPRKSISHLYFTMIGALAVILLSTIFSFIFGFEDAKKVDPKLLAPFLRKYIKSEFVEVASEDHEESRQIEMTPIKK